MSKPIRTTAFALALAALTIQPVASAQQGTPADVVVNMRGVEIADVADQISRITGRTLILDPSVKGVVTVTSAEPLTPDGVWELFQSVLRANGFAAVRSGRAWRIIPQANAIRDGGVATRSGSNQEVVTRLIRLRNITGENAARVLRPLVASFGSVETLPDAIVVTDYADNVRRIERLARSLDSGGGSNVETITLRNGNARDVAEAIQGIIGDTASPGSARVAADERSNTIIVRGDADAIAEARRIARVLDAPGGATPITRVFRLSNTDAESITEVLQGVLGQPGQASNPVARSLGGSRLDQFGASGNSASALGAAVAAGGAAGGITGSSSEAAAAIAGASGGGAQAAPVRGFTTPELTVQPAPELNAIVVRGTPSAIASIESLIKELDVRRPQVMIEAAIVEITGDDAEALGIQLGIGAGTLSQVEGAGTSFSTAGTPLRSILAALGAPAAALLSDGISGNLSIGNDFSILVQALSQSTKANLLSTPSLTTLDNVPSEIVVAQNVPFRTGSFATEGNTINPFTTIERRDVGLILRVIPRIHDGNVVRLEVSQEVSSLASISIAGAADLITNRRSIRTTVLADNTETIVLGGLISDDQTEVRSQVPVLGDIPIVGELFKSRREARTRRTLFVFLKPTILRDGPAASAAAREKYTRLRIAETDSLDRESLLLAPPLPRLTVELDGVY